MTIERATEQISYTVSGVGTFAGLVFNEWLALGGFIIMLMTFAVNTYFRLKRDEREQKIADRKFDAEI